MRLLVLVFLAMLSFGATAAFAEGEGQAPGPDIQETSVSSPHGDRVESADKGMAVLFWAFAAASIAGALFVITRRNLIAAVMGMVGSFLGIAAVYMMLYAHFLAVIQMLVYAGAIMVLFVFVIMILNRPEDEPVAPTGHLGQAIGGIAILYLIGRLVMLLVSVQPPAGVAAVNAAIDKRAAAGHAYDQAVAQTAKAERDTLAKAIQSGVTMWDPVRWTELAEAPTVEPFLLQELQAKTAHEAAKLEVERLEANAAPPKTPEGHDWGSIRAVGTDLFNGGLFPFEAISILLLLAVVGAIAIARPLKDDDPNGSSRG